MKRIFLITLTLFSLVILIACGSSKASNELQPIKIGATAGPYSDQINDSIKGLLEKSGYQVEVIEFNDYIQPNKSLDEGDINVNVFQNQLYLDKFNEEHEMDLVSILAVPTAPIGLYSEKLSDIAELEENMKITLPNDPVNLARSLLMMEEFGWIKFADEIDPIRASENDIVENKYNLEIVPLEAAQLPRSLNDTDFAFVNGNFALSSGLKLEDAVELEETPDYYLNYVVVRKEDEDSALAEALKKAYQSEEFLQYTDKELPGFVKPAYQQQSSGDK